MKLFWYSVCLVMSALHVVEFSFDLWRHASIYALISDTVLFIWFATLTLGFSTGLRSE